MTLPFKVHPTHKCVYVGGYAACLKCAALQACARKGQSLVKVCRGFAPASSKASLKRALEGKKPTSRNSVWPNGQRVADVRQLASHMYSAA